MTDSQIVSLVTSLHSNGSVELVKQGREDEVRPNADYSAGAYDAIRMMDDNYGIEDDPYIVEIRQSKIRSMKTHSQKP